MIPHTYSRQILLFPFLVQHFSGCVRKGNYPERPKFAQAIPFLKGWPKKSLHKLHFVPSQQST